MIPIDILEHRGTFFKIVGNSANSQIGVMTIAPGEDSGPEEKHPGDQVVYVIEGEAEIEIEKERYQVRAGEAMIIPAMSQHHIYNKTDNELFMLTVYAPPSY
jgi:quercetin dioxygenase-like cupin family protein